MRKIIAVLISLIFLTVLAPTSLSDTEDINVTLTPSGNISINVDQPTWAPSVGIGGSLATDTDWANLDNDGNVQVDVTVEATDTPAWTLSTAPGHNLFQMQWGVGSAGSPESLSFPENSTGGDVYPICDVASLTSTRFVTVSYDSSFTDSHAYVRVGEYVGGSISWVTNTVDGDVTDDVWDDVIDSVSVAALDSTHFVVTWNFAVAGGLSSRVGHVDGTDIVWDTDITSTGYRAYASSTYISSIDTTALSSTTFVIAFKKSGTPNSNKIHVVMGSFVDGSSLEFAGLAVVDSRTGGSPKIDTLDSEHFVIVYGSATNQNYVRVGELISWTTDAVAVGPSGGPDYKDVKRYNSTSFVIAYADGTVGTSIIGNYGYDEGEDAVIISWVTSETSFVDVGYVVFYLSACMIDDTTFVISYGQNDSVDTPEGWSVVGRLNGTSIDFPIRTLVRSAFGFQGYLLSPSMARLDNTHFVLTVANGAVDTYLGLFDAGSIGGASWTNILTSPASFVSNLAWDQSQDFGLQVFMPTSTSSSANQTSTITFTATAD